ncbi:MAG: hypothetical protein L6V89_06310 [Oscillospiraceae bacterium]|nr:MAG: hypothetical protein L6V89_06310 [Oscillospiraceae bacterium]
MKKALCLAAAVLFTIGLTGCDTGPSSSSTAGITETKDTVTAGVTETAKTPTNTVPTQEAAEMLEKTKAALDEFIKIQEKNLNIMKHQKAQIELIEKIKQDNADVALANIPTIDKDKIANSLGQIIQWSEWSSWSYNKGSEFKELYHTAVRGDGERAYCVFDVKEGIRYYLFYDNSIEKKLPNMSLGHIGYPLLINKVHTRAEFEALKTGDSILKVEETDSVTSFYRERFIDWKSTNGHSVHYLEDGLAIIEYKLNQDGTDYIINDIELIKGYKYTDKFLLNKEVEVNCEINPLDLPQ